MYSGLSFTGVSRDQRVVHVGGAANRQVYERPHNLALAQFHRIAQERDGANFWRYVAGRTARGQGRE